MLWLRKKMYLVTSNTMTEGLVDDDDLDGEETEEANNKNSRDAEAVVDMMD